MRAAVFLDRDGVLNRALIVDGKPYAPARPEEFELVSEAPEQTRRLKEAGFALFVVTNQPEVSRGNHRLEDVDAMHAIVLAATPVDEVYVCFHDDADNCDCRKPKPGLLTRAASEHHIDLTTSFMVGDRWRDVEAGQRAGVRTVFIDYSYQERRPTQPADAVVHSLTEAVDWILATTKSTEPAQPRSREKGE